MKWKIQSHHTHRWFLLLLCVFLLGATACAPKQDVVPAVLEDLKPVLRAQDERRALFETALTAAAAYSGAPSDETLMAAKSTCLDATRQTLCLEEAISALDEDAQRSMVKANINLFDYQVPFQMQAYEKYEQVQTLLDILYALNSAPALDEPLAYLVDMQMRYGTLECKVDFLGLNDLLAHVPEEKLSGFKVDFLSGLTAFGGGNALVWETDRSLIEKKANGLFIIMEDEIEDYAVFIGDRYADLLSIQRQDEQALLAAGIPPDEATAMLGEIETLAKRWEEVLDTAQP